MPLRMTGMMSGMDTESIIKDLVNVRKKKVDTKKKAQTKLEWKQDAWKDLNTKLKNLQSKFLSNMRFTSAYSKKTSKVSNSTAVSVITGESAVNGVQTMKVEKLAKTGYLTGAEIEGNNGELTALSKLSDIRGFEGMTGDGSGTITFKTGNKSVDLKVDENTTISDILTQAKSIGLNASFDAKNQRIFISAKESGAANDFSMIASNDNGAKALTALGLQADLSKDTATMAEYQKYSDYYVAGNRTQTLNNMGTLINDTVNDRTNAYLDQYKSLMSSKEASQNKLRDLTDRYGTLDTAEHYADELATVNSRIEALDSSADDYASRLEALQNEANELQEKKSAAEAYKAEQENIAGYDEQMEKIAGAEGYITVTPTGDGGYGATATNKLQTEVKDAYYAKAEYGASVVAGNSQLAASGATKVSGEDAIIWLNDARFTNTNNTFEINGLTITALNETKEGEVVTITTEQDTDGIYDMVKNFLKEYNALVNEMDKLYNAESSKGYEPLLDDEKDEMSDSEVEKWEKKIKDSLLRRDENLSNVNSALQSIMASGFEINGRTMYLHDFGIETLGYFNAPDNEKHAYHIDGDPDDGYTSGNSDKLKSMIANDPDTVITFFTKLSQSLYGKMSDMSKSVDGYRSFGSFYDDKKMKTDYIEYTSKIKDMENKLADYEDKWYSKFSKMETALAKMQSNASAVTSLLGG